jgi:1-deoxy-D-xylulose-5-phosphate synthase
MYQLLDKINSPQDLKSFSVEDLELLAQELRNFLLQSVSKTGGHFASNLGSIELTIALHYIYNTPQDLIVWDVGHQTYAHKILTGRMNLMHTMRKFSGLSGFPNRKESEYDTFGVGHSSTSISAALGMAVAKELQHKNDKVVAIIGDGGMTAGLAYEGLNNAGWLDKDVLIILNDNEMSISENVGAISRYLAQILTSRFYNTIKKSAHDGMKNHPLMRQIAHKVEEHIKGLLTPSSTLFEEFGFNYTGPIDGHDISTLINTLTQVKQLNGAQFLHVVTKKGHGYKLAEDAPIDYHGVSKFDLIQGIKDLKPDLSSTKLSALSYTQVFGKWLCDKAKFDNRFVAITPAMREGSGMVEFAKAYPNQFFDVGIAEQHAITFAAGVAAMGIKAIVAIYSTFLQRGYDQLIHDVALQGLPVLFAIDRGGIVGADGATHIGAFDLSYMRCIPNLVIIAPSSQHECYLALDFGFGHNAPVALRYPRGLGINNGNYSDNVLSGANSIINFSLGQAKLLRHREEMGNITNNNTNTKIAFLAFGTMVNVAFELSQELNATCVDMRFIKPLDEEIINSVAKKHDFLVILEENVLMGGASSACVELLSDLFARKVLEYMPKILRFGLPDEFIEQGDIDSLLEQIELTKEAIKNNILNLIEGDKQC